MTQGNVALSLSSFPDAFSRALYYFYEMRTIPFLFFALTLGTGYAQFIPQQMGYNPDVNGDSNIGVTDLQGVLSLYEQPFNSGDSIVAYVANIADPLDTLSIIENTGVLYIVADGPENAEFVIDLPSGSGFKSLLVLMRNVTMIAGSAAYLRFIGQGDCNSPDGYCGISFQTVSSNESLHKIFIRGQDGFWYRPAEE